MKGIVMREGWDTLEFLQGLNPNFTGFTVETVRQIDEDAYVCTAYAGELPPIKKLRKKRLRRDITILWNQDCELLAFGTSFNSGIPNSAFGWLLAEINQYHWIGVRTIARVFVEPPTPDAKTSGTLHVQCSWVVPLVLAPTPSTTQVLRDALEWTYVETDGLSREMREAWRTIGKA